MRSGLTLRVARVYVHTYRIRTARRLNELVRDVHSVSKGAAERVPRKEMESINISRTTVRRGGADTAAIVGGGYSIYSHLRAAPRLAAPGKTRRPDGRIVRGVDSPWGAALGSLK